MQTLYSSIYKLLIYYLSEIFSPSHCQVQDKDQQAEPPSHSNTKFNLIEWDCIVDLYNHKSTDYYFFLRQCITWSSKWSLFMLHEVINKCKQADLVLGTQHCIQMYRELCCCGMFYKVVVDLREGLGGPIPPYFG